MTHKDFPAQDPFEFETHAGQDDALEYQEELDPVEEELINKVRKKTSNSISTWDLEMFRFMHGG